MQPSHNNKKPSTRSIAALALAITLLPATLLANSSTVSLDTSNEVSSQKIVLGWLQSIKLLPHKLRMTAKLDTGAKKSVMHARDIKPFKQAGKDWVHFTVPAKKDDQEVELVFELPVLRKSRIKQHHIDQLDVRYVVKMDFCIGGKTYTADFSLDNREKFNYPVLLGRDFIKKHFIVDPSQKFVKRYNCI